MPLKMESRKKKFKFESTKLMLTNEGPMLSLTGWPLSGWLLSLSHLCKFFWALLKTEFQQILPWPSQGSCHPTSHLSQKEKFSVVFNETFIGLPYIFCQNIYYF